jgi:hypothetical protein
LRELSQVGRRQQRRTAGCRREPVELKLVLELQELLLVHLLLLKRLILVLLLQCAEEPGVGLLDRTDVRIHHLRYCMLVDLPAQTKQTMSVRALRLRIFIAMEGCVCVGGGLTGCVLYELRATRSDAATDVETEGAAAA